MSLNYKAFYPGKRAVEIYDASSSYDAHKRAAILWGIPLKRQYLINIVLAEKDNVPVVHTFVD